MCNQKMEELRNISYPQTSKKSRQNLFLTQAKYIRNIFNKGIDCLRQKNNRIFPLQINPNIYKLVLIIQIERKVREISLNFSNAFEENQLKLLQQFENISDIYHRRLENKNSYIIVEKDYIFNVNLVGQTMIIEYLQKKGQQISKYIFKCRKQQEVRNQKQKQFQQLLQGGVKQFFDQYFMVKRYKFQFNKESRLIVFDQIIMKNRKQIINKIPISLERVEQLNRYQLYEQYTSKKMIQMQRKLKKLERYNTFLKEINQGHFVPEKSDIQDFIVSSQTIKKIKKPKKWSELCIQFKVQSFSNKNTICQIEFLLPNKNNELIKIDELNKTDLRKSYIKVKDIRNKKQLILYNTGQIINSEGECIVKSKIQKIGSLNVKYEGKKLISFIYSSNKVFGSIFGSSEIVEGPFQLSQNIQFYIGVAQLNQAYKYSLKCFHGY